MFTKREYEELARLKDFFSFTETKKRVDWSNIAQELITPKPGFTCNKEIAKIIKDAQDR